MIRILLLAMIAALCWTLPAAAHEVRPAFLDIVERGDGTADVTWKQPFAGALTVALTPSIGGIALGQPRLVGATGVAMPEPASAADTGEVTVHPDREAYFGDLHLHTTNSFDAYMLMGTRATPDEAYTFARGDTVEYLGQPIRRSCPLDFLAVTDHFRKHGRVQSAR